MQPLLFYKISISYHIFRGKKRGFEKTVLFSAAWQGYINPLSKIFLPGTRHSPNSPTRIIFTWHLAQERPPKKIRRIFVPLFPKTHRRSLIFAQTGIFPAAISEKGYKNKRVLIFSVPCARCFLFVLRFPPLPQSACKKIRAFCLHEIFRCAIMLFGNTEPPVPCAR